MLQADKERRSGCVADPAIDCKATFAVYEYVRVLTKHSDAFA